MTYVDAMYDRDKDIIRVVERVNGKRVFIEKPAEHVLYYEHPAGQHRSIFGDSVKKFTTNSSKLFRRELARLEKAGNKLFESDINLVFRHLADNYTGAETPTLNLGFFDIEADYDAERGWAPADDPFNAITAITIYLSSTKTLHTVALCPPTMTIDEAVEATADFPDTVVYDDEKFMLNHFLELIEDVDIVCGFNSEFYDVPYLVNRVSRLLGKRATRRFCLWDQEPREREFKKYGRVENIYELVGRVHLDYLLLYKKHNTQQLQSYKLANIGLIEVGETKTQYEGNLDDLYKKDFKRFIEYNRQDVHLLVLIEKERKFIDLSNQIAHANCVQLKTTMGTVALTEQAIINFMHSMGMVAPNRKPRPDKSDAADDEDESSPVVGAYVAKPKVGIVEHLGVVDINSLYPSAIRALNMSPETIVGQVRLDLTMKLVEERIAKGIDRAEAWEGIFETLEVTEIHKKSDTMLTIDFENDTTKQLTAAQINHYVFKPNSYLCISANGTIFKTDTDGVIPSVLANWINSRKEMQAKAREATEISLGFDVDPELADLIRSLG